jgi:TRAP-type uncharacterized transport system substrate-binding protein
VIEKFLMRRLKSSAPQRYFTIRVVMEKDVFRGVVADVTQIGVINVLVTHERILEPVVYAMAKTIADKLDDLPEMNPLFKGLKIFSNHCAPRAPRPSSSAVWLCIRVP